jgi:hypothetical protein
MPFLSAVLFALALGTVFRCPDPTDASVPLFTDEPCPGGTAISESAANAIAPAPLTQGERATLERIDHDHARAPRATPSAHRADDGREQRCAAARRGLDEIRATRRRGYRVSSSARLDADESRLRAEVEASCGAL